MKKISETLWAEFPDRVTQAGQSARQWLELNGWEFVTGEGDDAVFKCPLTRDNYRVAECLRRQGERPIEDQVVLLIKSLKSQVELGSPSAGEKDKLVGEIGALQTELDNLKIQNSDLNGRLQLMVDGRDQLNARLEAVTKERDSAHDLELSTRAQLDAANAALDAAKSELTSLKAAPAPAP